MTDILNKSYKSLLRVPFACMVCALLWASASSVHSGTIGAGNQTVLYISDQASGANLFGWGANSSGQIGDDSAEDRLTPVMATGDGPWLAVATNLTGVSDSILVRHSLGIKADGAAGTQGTLWAWGDNSFGQLGLGDATNRLVPTQVGSASNWIAVEAGSAFSMALNAEGEIWVWGDNRFGKLGAGVVAYFQSTPTQLADKDGDEINNDQWVSIAAGADYALAVHRVSPHNPNEYGYIYAWGRNSFGQLGLGHTNTVSGPSSATRIPGTTLWRSVEAGISASFAINTSGYLYAWGQAGFGGLGLGSNQGTSIGGVSSPTREATEQVFDEVSAGSSHTLALTSSGQLFATGQNASGQLGKFGSQRYNTFQFIDGDVAEIAAGNAFSVIVKYDGSVLTAGSNARGQLGNGTTSPVATFSTTALGSVDLSVGSVVIVNDLASVASGTVLDIQLVLRNNGTGSVDIGSSPTFFEATLEPILPAVGALSSVPLTGIRYSSTPASTNLAPSAELSLSLQTTIPAGVSIGSYQLELVVDALGAVDEFNEDNNSALSAAESPLEFTFDLASQGAPAIVDPSASYEVGDTFSVSFELQNLGTGDFKASEQAGFKLRFALTPDFDDVSDATLIELSPVAGSTILSIDEDLLAQGSGSYTNSIKFTVPLGVEAIDYYVVLFIDADATFDEVDETNNTQLSTSKQLSVAEIDLDVALDAPGVSFATAGNADWFGFNYSDAEGGDAAYSPTLTAGQQASLRTTVSTPSTLTFKWRASTSGESNYLQLNAGAQVLSISGETQWETVSLAVGAGTDVVWTYYAGSGGAGEQVFIDDVSMTTIAGPDVFVPGALLLDAANQPINSASLVAGVDAFRLAYELKNQGDDLSGAGFDVDVYLSRDSNFDPEEDTPIGATFEYNGAMASGFSDTIVTEFTPPSYLLGDYYLIVHVSGVSGEAVLSNNTYISDDALINVQQLPDLSLNLTSINGNIFYPGNSIAVDYALENRGYGDAFGLLQLRLVLSEDQTYSAGEDFIIGEGLYFGGISAGDPLSPNTKSNRFSLFAFPADLPVGDFKYIGLVVDSGDAFNESDETNNVVFTENPAYAFGTVSIDLAVEYDVSTPNSSPFSTGFPFFGQADVSSDGDDALQSARIDDSEKSYFETTVNVSADSILSYYWKVSSEDAGADKRDSLKLYSNGQLRSSIAGEVDWTRQTLLLPASGSPYTLRWSYEKDSSGSAGEDMAWVDQIAVEVLSQPDLSFSSVQLVDDGSEVESASYIIGFDPLSMNYDVRNGGVSHPAGDDIQVHFYLSEDALLDGNDYPVDGSSGLVQNYAETLASNAQFSNSPSITIDTSIPAGEYYLIGIIDEVGSIAEFDEDNNTFVSDGRIVQLLALPDLIIEYTDQNFGGLKLIDSELSISTEITNQGYGVVEGAFDVQFLLSSDQTVDASDLLLRDYSQTQNLTAPSGGNNAYTFAPALGAVGDQVPFAERLYLATVVDAADDFSESDELNNIAPSTLPVFIFGQVGLSDALDWQSQTADLQNNETSPFTGALPFVGLNEASTVSDDIARSTIMTDGESSGFVLNLDLKEPAALSFFWKVSSERIENTDGTIKQDAFSVYLDNTQHALISGEVDWHQQIVLVPAGAHEIRWAYEKDSSFSAGSDSAWIDNLRLLPDLGISSLTISSTGDLSLLRPIDPLEVELVVANTNLGDLLPNAEYAVEVRLSKDAEWGNEDDVVLNLSPQDGTETPIVGLPSSGESVTLNFNSLVPEEAAAGDYYVLARVDPDASEDAVNAVGSIAEVDDENNDFSSAPSAITVTALSIVDSLDISSFDTAEYRIVFPVTANSSKMVQMGDASWAISPDIEVDEHFKRWFAVAGVDGALDGEDAIKSPVLNAGSAASLLFRLDQPRVVSFRVKPNTNSSRNYMFFGANGNALRPEGLASTAFFSGTSDVDSEEGWQTVRYIAPAGAPIGFTYVQELAAVGDERVFVDQLQVGAPISEPDYVIDSLQYDAGEYVLDRDRLFVVVKGSNRGSIESPLPSEFKVKVWLSTNASWDASDISLGYLEKFQELDQGTTFAYQASLILPESLPETSYYLIARVDAEDAVSEFAINDGGEVADEPEAFTQNDNNFFVSPSRDIFIDRRADLRALPSEDSLYGEIQVSGPAADPDFANDPNTIHDLFIIAPTEAEGPSELLIKFDIENEGLSGVSAAGSDDFVINVYAAESRDEEPSADRLITSFVETRGLAAGSRTTYEVTTDIPGNIEAGKFYYLHVVVDATNVIPESDEEDNSTFSSYSNVFAGEVSLAVALNDEGIENAWDYSFVVPTEGDSTLQAPFYGTRTDFAQDNTASGIRGAAQSGRVPIGGTTWMQTTLEVESKRLVSFRWKVSSQFEIRDGIVVEDILQFGIRGDDDADFVTIAKISGEHNWAEFTHSIEQPGTYTLRWSYAENGDDARAGADAGWVDDFSAAAYDFVPTFVAPSQSETFNSGDPIEVRAYVWNIKERQIPDAGVTVQIRLSPTGQGDESNLDWSFANATDVELTANTGKFSQLDTTDLIWLRDHLNDLVSEMDTSELSAAMEAGILALLNAEASEVEPELSLPEITVLREVLTNSGWTAYTDGQIELILAVGQSTKEQNARKRFLPVRTYATAPNLSIPQGLSVSNSYTMGVWVNPLELLLESNTTNNLLWGSGAAVQLTAAQNIPYVLDQDSDSNPDLDDPDALDQDDEWTLSGDGRWYPDEDATAEGGWSLHSPDPATQEIPQDGSAVVAALVEGPTLLRFQWRSDFGSALDIVKFSINGTQAERESQIPATAMQLTGADDVRGWVDEQIFIPAGLQEISWSYFRVDDGEAQGRVFLDNVRFEAVEARADFAVVDVEYSGGTYALERDQFPLNVTVMNRGSTPTGFDYNDLDVEVRLAVDHSFDTASEIIGNLSVVDVLNSGQRLIFQGNIDLPANLNPGSYYLLVRVHSLDPLFEEFVYDTNIELTANNDYASPVQDIEIVHLPQLIVWATDVENEKLFYPEETIRFDWELENIGLGDIPAGTELTQRIELWQFGVDEAEFSLANGTKVMEVDSVTENVYIPGRLTATDPSQSRIQYRQIFKLPGQADLLAALGSVEEGLEDMDTEVIDAMQDFEDYQFFFVIIRDQSIEQSSDINLIGRTDERFRISAFPYDSNPDVENEPMADVDASITYEQWRSFIESRVPAAEAMPSSDPMGEFASSDFENFNYYAFNLPLVTDLSQAGINLIRDGETTVYQQSRRITIGTEQYPAITFPVVRGAADLRYVVESSDNGDDWTESFVIEGPYLDDLLGRKAGFNGADSLTGEEGLIDQHAPYIWSVVDNNYTAVVTARSDQSLSDQPDRKLRVRAEPIFRNLEVVSVSLTTSEVYSPGGDTINTWSVTVKNTGSSAIEAPFDVAIRLMPSASWSDSEAVTLLTITDAAGLAAGDSRTYAQGSDGVLTLPAGVYADEFYYYGAYADVNDAITESFEDDNLLIHGSASLQVGLPDVKASGVSGVVGSYRYGDALSLDVALDNIGEGVLLGDSAFDVRVLLVPNFDAGVTNSSQAYELGTLSVSGSEVAAGASFAAQKLSADLPYGIANGDYFIAVQVDRGSELLEQGPLESPTRIDGESNNEYFSSSAVFTVDNEISLADALDQDALTIEVSGDGAWFSRDDAGDVSTDDDDQSFVDGDGVQSPLLAEDERASFSFVSDAAYMVGFDYIVSTGSVDSRLSVSVNGAVQSSYSGNAAARVEVQVAAGDRIDWTYTQGPVALGEVAYVDNLSLTAVVSPDLTVTGVDLTQSGAVVASGSYVLNRDRLDLSVSSRNLGTDLSVSSRNLGTDVVDDFDFRIDFSIEVYLSRDSELDASDTLIRTYLEDQGAEFLSGNSSVNGFSIDLPESLEAGAYYVIAQIDSEDAIAEFSELNNTYASASAVVTIVRLADLVVSDFSAQPGYYLVDDATDTRNFLDFEFRIENQGLADVAGPVAIRVLLSGDSVLDPAEDYAVLEYLYNGSLAVGDSILVDPDAVDIRTDVPLGAYQFFGVYIDSTAAVTESSESNNASALLDNDFVFSERTLREGLDLSGSEVINDEAAPYAGDQQPWVVQSSESVDGEDAVTNVLVGDGESASFSVTVSPSSDVRVSFWWKVSSQDDADGRDALSFSVDGVEAVAPIFGTDASDWVRVDVSLSAGAHTLAWTYAKDAAGSAGEDRGWVDRLVVTELPNLEVSDLTLDSLPVYRPDGDTIDSWLVTVTNSGASAIEAGTSFDVAVRVLPSASWSDSEAVTLLTITDEDGLGAGASRTYDQDTHGALALPAGVYADEFYYYGAYADWSLSAGGSIIESFEDDNSQISVLPRLQVGLPDVVVSGVSGVSGPYSYGDDLSLYIALDNIGEGVLLAESGFDVRVLLVPNLNAGVTNSSQAYDLGTLRVSGSEVAAGAGFAAQQLSTDLPYGIANGDYYIAVQVDRGSELLEQGALSEAAGDSRDRIDGESNNVYFSSSEVFTVDNEISLADALDQDALTIEVSGDGAWFSRDDAGDVSTDDDDQSFVDDGDGVQSPLLAEDERASFSFFSAPSQLIRFDWLTTGVGANNVLAVFVNGDERGSISGSDQETAVEILVSEGSTVTWTYTFGEASSGASAYVDNLELVANDLPDLAITEVNYVAGEYVLDRAQAGMGLDANGDPQYLQTKYLDVVVTAGNQGKDLTLADGSFTTADIEMRLSLNDTYGDVDDVILGSFAQVEGDFSSGNLLSFLGPIALGDHIPADTYYLMARIDSNDRATEYTEQNNLWVSSARDIQITRLPDLRIENSDARSEQQIDEEVLTVCDIVDVDETGAFYTASPMRVRFNIQNIGLGDVDGSQSFVTQVNLRGIKRPEFEIDPWIETLNDLPGVVTAPIILGEFSIQDEFKGRSFDPDTGAFPGDSKPVDVELMLPEERYFLDVIDADAEVSHYLWFIEVIVNRDGTFSESSTWNTWWSVDPNKVDDPSLLTYPNGGADDGFFGIDAQSMVTDAASWESIYPRYPTTDPKYLLAYAFNRNPVDADTASNQFTGSYGFDEVDEFDYLSISFDFQHRVEDLVYLIEASNDLNTWEEVASIDTTLGSFTELVGPLSLSADGGLIDSDPNIISITDLGAYARITVRDDITSSAPGTRFMRVTVRLDRVSEEATPVPPSP